MRVPRGARAAAIGAAGGLFAGLTGVGGGAILVPLLVSALRMRQHAAHGTSLAVIGAGALAGAATYARTTSIDWPLAMTLLPTALLGAAAGATFVQRIPAIRLRALFGAFLFAVALRMALPLGGAAAHVDG
ncbi:TSUP family transporter, partial [Thermoflexus hugenholtzii]